MAARSKTRRTDPAPERPAPVFVLAFTGASGAIYGVRLLEVLRAAGAQLHLLISPAAVRVFEEELDLSIDLDRFEPEQIHRRRLSRNPRIAAWKLTDLPKSSAPAASVAYHTLQDWGAPVASGSFQTDGMVICPCSMGTLASVANGLSTNLIQRAADVHLKERRKLIVVPRETPLGSIQLRNMQRLSSAGGIILPAMPGFYHRPESVGELVDFVVGRICDQLGVGNDLIRRWGDSRDKSP